MYLVIGYSQILFWNTYEKPVLIIYSRKKKGSGQIVRYISLDFQDANYMYLKS